ncbi:hypothetical protein [Streptomyces sp. SDr-06]|uniref:hypothetical protein n=1 Tax=Streptomyces sp. SDr-06 TaxID=2267702 RepID=UPI000DE9D659|nr:hypothetical protein [Streptomyces sp. SDr-06]
MLSSHVVDAPRDATTGIVVLGARAVADEVAPAPLGHAVLSRGVEGRAGSASLAARRSPLPGGVPRRVVGGELVAAAGALLRRGPGPDPEPPIGRAFALADSVRDEDTSDRPLTADVDRAAAPLDRFKELNV